MGEGRLDLLRRMLESDPRDAFCRYAMGQEHASRGEREEAIRWFDRTIEVDPDYCYAYFHKARIQAESGRKAEAVQTLQAGLARARACADTHAAGEISAMLDELEG